MDSDLALESKTTRSSARKRTAQAIRDRHVAPRFVGSPAALSARAIACNVAPPRSCSTARSCRDDLLGYALDDAPRGFPPWRRWGMRRPCRGAQVRRKVANLCHRKALPWNARLLLAA